jgi:hypothetical protein
MSGVILSSVIEIGVLLWLLAGIASLWVWGGARRGALGHLMAGAVLLVSGAIFTYVPRINAFARMDNSYLGNAWIGSILMLVGIILLIGSLAGYGVPAWLTALLCLASLLLNVYSGYLLARTPSVGDTLHQLSPSLISPGSGYLLSSALILGGVLLYVTLRGDLAEALIAIALISAGVALAWQFSGGDLRAFTPVASINEPFYKPPVLDFGQLLVCLLVASILFFAGRFIQGRLRGQQPLAVGQVASSS